MRQSAIYLLVLLSSLLALPSGATDRRPIESAFGFKLGAFFSAQDPRAVAIESQGEWGGTIIVKPEQTIDGFSDYRISHDHKGRIMTIQASGAPPTMTAARELQRSLAALYEGYTQVEEKEDLAGGQMTYFYIKDRKDRANRVISLDYWYQEGEGTGWTLQYTHRSLARENLNAEFEARQRQRREKAEEELGDVL